MSIESSFDRLPARAGRLATWAGLLMIVGGATALPAAAQRTTDDSRPGGVELKPTPAQPPAAAIMAPSPSTLFSKPTVTPPVLPTPVQATPPVTAPAQAPAVPAKPALPATPPSGKAPAENAPAGPAEKDKSVPAEKGKSGAADTKTPLTAEDITKALKAPPPKATGAAPAERRTRSLQIERSPAIGAPPGGPANSDTPVPSGSMKGNDRLPGGVERAPGVQ